MDARYLLSLSLAVLFMTGGLRGEGMTIRGDEALFRHEVTTPSLPQSFSTLKLRDSTRLIYDYTPVGAKANIRPELGLSSVFTERLLVRSRHKVGDGVALVSSSGLGLSRSGSSWRAFDSRAKTEEESVLYQDSGIELQPVNGLTVRVSSRLARQVDASGAEHQDWSSGVVVALTPANETSFYAGAFGGQDLLSGGRSRIFTGGVDTRLAGTSLTLSASGWSVIGTADSTAKAEFSSSGAVTSLSWQVGDAVWQSAGVQRDISDGGPWSYSGWRYYLFTLFRTGAQTSLGLEVSHTRTSDQPTLAGPETELSETRLRISRYRRLLDNLTTEFSVEWAVGSMTTMTSSAHPSLRVAGQLAF